MGLREWLAPPRHLIVLFVGVTTLSAGALGWATWQIVRQDRDLRVQRQSERRDHLAGLVAETLQQRFTALETDLQALASAPESTRAERIAAFAASLPSSAVVLAMDDQAGRIDAYPAGRLLYYPTAPASHDPATFADADRAEYQRDLARATSLLEPASLSRDETMRAGALLRLARIQRKAGQPSRALATYRTLSDIHGIDIDGMPVDLVARAAICEVLAGSGDRGALVDAATALKTDLDQGRWRLTRAVYDDYATLVHDTLGLDAPDVSDSQGALSEAASWAWERRADLTLQNGRHVTTAAGRPVLVVGRGTAPMTLAFVTLPEDVVSAWLSDLAEAEADAGARYSLADIDGTVIAGTTDQAGQPSTRLPSATGLPWMVSTFSLPLESAGVFGERGLVFAAGLAAVGLLVIGGSYLTGRAVSRELQVARMQADFVSAVSHEFRTPLTAIRQLSELLTGDRAPTEAMRREYSAAIHKESTRLHRLVEGLLRFGRMEAGVLEFQPVPVDPVELVERVVADFRHEAARNGHEVELSRTGAAVTIRVDRDALGAAMWNLLDNAVKYSPGCPSVQVDVHGDQAGVRIRVRDHGIGIAPDDRDRIFGTFVRGRDAATLGVQGTGIGLAVARRIVTRHGGTLEVESTRGEGSTFTIALPVE